MRCKLRRDAGLRCARVNECLRAGTGELSLFIAGSPHLLVGRLDGPAREELHLQKNPDPGIVGSANTRHGRTNLDPRRR